VVRRAVAATGVYPAGRESPVRSSLGAVLVAALGQPRGLPLRSSALSRGLREIDSTANGRNCYPYRPADETQSKGGVRFRVPGAS
jgi:hypothetical protein